MNIAETPWYVFRPVRESLDECKDRRLAQMPLLSSAEMEVLKQCSAARWDGNIASKAARDRLFERGLITRFNGWQIVTTEGLAILEILGCLKA